MIRVVVAGCKGRMGSKIASLVDEAPDMFLAAGVDQGDSLEDALHECDVIVDFTVASAAARSAKTAAAHGKAIVIGTTGLMMEERLSVEEASRVVPVVFSPNMSVGVNVMMKLVALASRVLKDRCRIEMVETHHAHKLDRPSGTAKRMLEIALRETGLSSDSDVSVVEEREATSQDRRISVRSIRAGEVVGDHDVVFECGGETLSISHRAKTREVFAHGAIAAARWVVGKPAGLYGMDDVLDLKI